MRIKVDFNSMSLVSNRLSKIGCVFSKAILIHFFHIVYNLNERMKLNWSTEYSNIHCKHSLGYLWQLPSAKNHNQTTMFSENYRYHFLNLDTREWQTWNVLGYTDTLSPRSSKNQYLFATTTSINEVSTYSNFCRHLKLSDA